MCTVEQEKRCSMKKVILNRLFPIILIMISVVIVGSVYKMIHGVKINHYLQYFIPCQGQRVVLDGNQTELIFYFIDEVELSEIATKSNIISIDLITDLGNHIVVDDWDIVSNAGFYTGSEYFSKYLYIYTTFESECTISTIKITYLDIVEEYDIGELKITIQDINNEMANTQIITNTRAFSSQGFIINEDTQYFVYEPSLLTIMASGFGGYSFSIESIHLGVEGLGIDHSSLRFVEGSIDFGITFQTNPENEKYISLTEVDVLPEQSIKIDVVSTSVQAIIAMHKTADFNDNPIVTVINPVYTCMDLETEVIYQFGDYNNYSVNIPHFISDDYVRNLLEDLGR
jgi:hypothetical protein